ncbi:MAG TPA: VOC family protein [Candidatus Dormibacteraeota bacterium]
MEIGNITVDCVDPTPLRDFWAAALGYVAEGEGLGWASARPAQPRLPRLYFQRVPESKVAKNRWHLDLNAADMGAAVDRLEALGAVRGRLFAENGDRWTTMLDPEGNEFCVQPAERVG